MQWLKVILSGLIEVVWVTYLNYAHNVLTWMITILFIALSFYLMLSATKQLPVGTVYAVFVGIGAVGTVIIDMLFINHTFSLIKLLFIVLLIIGIIGLKLSTDEQSEGGQ
ncbi:paired small multidrug resistance pump [Staphylococcus hominis]